MDRYSAEAWERTADLRRMILDHPFNRELAAGTLAPDRFRGYVLQDGIYLEGFARALALASARAPDRPGALFWARQAGETIQIERQLHDVCHHRFGITPAAAATARAAPATLAYVSFLLALAAQEPYEVLVAGLLPCYWIYQEVGRTIRAESAGENPYGDWIATYGGDVYGAIVAEVIALADRLAAAAPPDRVGRMHEAFLDATRLEWWFWDGAYRQERWPDERKA